MMAKPPEEVVNQLVTYVIDNLQGSMLNLQLQKAAQVKF